MKNRKSTKNLIILLPLFFGISCGNQSNQLSETEIFTTEGVPGSAVLEKPYIDLESAQELLLVKKINLDEDRFEEQILIIAETLSGKNELQILVVDRDETRSIYYVSWKTSINAGSKNHIALETMDLIGDHILEIVFMGMDASGKQTLDIFRQTPSTRQQSLVYENIFSQTALGVIEIQQIPRSDAYNMGQIEDVSFPIIIEEKDPDPEVGPLDTLRTTYIWRFQENTFVPSQIEKIQRQAIQVTGAAEFAPSSTENLKLILEGIWRRDSVPEVILDFQPTQKSIIFSTAAIQEIYQWTNTIRTRPNGLTIQGVNVLTIEKKFPLQIQYSLIFVNRNRIMLLSSFPEENMPGTYTRVESFQEEKIERTTPFELSGTYANESGISMDFQKPFYVWHNATEKLEGGYSLFYLNEWILQLKSISPNGRPLGTSNFKVDFFEDKESIQIKRELLLTPVNLTVSGIRPKEGNAVRLQQIEILNAPR